MLSGAGVTSTTAPTILVLQVVNPIIYTYNIEYQAEIIYKTDSILTILLSRILNLCKDFISFFRHYTALLICCFVVYNSVAFWGFRIN